MPHNDQPLVGEILNRNQPSGYGGPVTVQSYTRRHSFARMLVGINIGVYVLMVLRGVSPFNPSIADLMHWGAMFGPSVVADGQYWRLLTSGFEHIGLVHLALNMWCLWYLAELAENMFGGWTLVSLYVLTAMTGNLFVLIWRPDIPTAGASGAIFGIAGAVVTALRVGPHRVPLAVRKAISNSALRFAVINLIIGFLPGISNLGHLGGMVGGLLLGAGYALTGSLVMQDNLPLRRALVSLAYLAVFAAVLLRILAVAHAHLPVPGGFQNLSSLSPGGRSHGN